MVKVLRVTLLAVLLVPTLAMAQVSLGLRAGYAIPAGEAYEQSGFGTFAQKDLVKGAIPLQLDASWRFTPALSAGLYVTYGFGQAGSKLKEMCSTPGASCTNPTTLSYGVQAAYGFQTGGSIEPWIGLGAGIQQASFKVKGFIYGLSSVAPPVPLMSDLSGTLRGWEGRLEGGADFRVGSALRVGPVLTVGFGQYRVEDVSISALGTVAAGGVDSPKTHELITIGLRGTYDL
jgi:opacity protein-like surface antigen